MPTFLFSRRICPCFITNPRYLNTQLPRFLHKSIPYITRAYARERKGYNVSTPRPASHESHPPTPFAHSHQRHKSKVWASALLSKTNEFGKTSGSIAMHQTNHANEPSCPNWPLKSSKGTFYKPSGTKKTRKNLELLKKSNTFAPHLTAKRFFQHRRKRKFG